MKLIPQSPKKALKAFLKQKPLRSEFNLFKKNLIELLDTIEDIEKQPKDESEEHLKNNIRDFLLGAFYRDKNYVNTKERKDLVIHLENKQTSKVGVIIEAKRPSNKNEMLSAASPNKKALHELILYYLDERNSKEGNFEMKQLVATNINEWYIIDANLFDKHIYNNRPIQNLYKTWLNDKKTTIFFYQEIEKIISKMEVDIPCIYFDIRVYNTALRNDNKEDDKDLVALFKVLSPSHLLKLEKANDSNYLDKKFYDELLHIIGLEEAKEGGKNIIRRKLANKNPASLIEMALKKLQTKGIHKIPDVTSFGDTTDEQHFNIALELCITWVNRILFLKLLEGQLKAYHLGNEAYKFLYTKTIHDFDELFKLFHNVLAINIKERDGEVQKKYSLVPYLNSSLFEISELEDLTISIESLDNSEVLPFNTSSILIEHKKENSGFKSLEYLFKFLDAYDFASEGTEGIQEDSKKMINASVLGKVFEKINGYKDGSIYTPGFITMDMCRKSIRLAMVQKFKDKYGWNIETFEDIKNYLADRKSTKDILEFNTLINSLRLCDPAVGSGHYLVSSLNELIVIKYELGILADDKGNRIRDYEISIENDELFITNENGDPFEYTLQNGKPKSTEIQRLQKTLFHEKQTIIENCLFGVDINPNSVKICRLRLWIELLKNAYYKEETNYTELETLPNIDINIKCGNSLLSRFPLDADLSKALKSIKYDIEAYRRFVNDYKNEKNREVKRGLQTIIDGIKGDFKTEIWKYDPKIVRLERLSHEHYDLVNQTKLFEDAKQKKAREEKQKKLESEIEKLKREIEEIKSNAIYKNAFEWRFEFPEVLNNEGDFEGFDLVIGNPPYIQIQSMGKESDALENANYKTFARTGDIYSLFYEKGNNILKANGTLAYITSNKWMRTDYGLNTRKYICENTNPKFLIDFGMVMVFEMATVYSNILIFQKRENINELKAVRIPNDYDLKSDLQKFFEDNYSNVLVNENAWVIQTKDIQQIKTKVEAQGLVLKDWNIKINRGILTGYNEAFIINGTVKDRLIAEDYKSQEIIKPILRGQDIKTWQPKFANLWVIFIPKGFTIKKNLPKDNIYYVEEPSPRYGNMEFDDAWYWFKEKYPAVAKYLLPFKSKAEARQDKGDYWWEQRACSYLEEFAKPKIVYPNMTKFLPFVYDEQGYYANQKCFIITSDTKCLKYLTAFFNSKLFKFCFKDNFPELLGNTFELSKVFFEQLPVKQLLEKDQKPFDNLVDKIIAQKQQDQDCTKNEKEIDRLVYNLYDITEYEQKIIEDK